MCGGVCRRAPAPPAPGLPALTSRAERVPSPVWTPGTREDAMPASRFTTRRFALRAALALTTGLVLLGAGATLTRPAGAAPVAATAARDPQQELAAARAAVIAAEDNGYLGT